MNDSLDTDHLASPEASQSTLFFFSKIGIKHGKTSALFAYEGEYGILNWSA